jgi:hypothetical protein
MCEFTIKCGEKFDIYFNNDDEAHHVTVKVHDECEGDNNFPVVEVRKKDGTALKPEKTQTMSHGGRDHDLSGQAGRNGSDHVPWNGRG